MTKSKKHSSKSTSKKTTKKSNVTEIFAKALAIDCPKCKVHKGHRCIYTIAHADIRKGTKRERPHRARLAKAKLAPKSKAKLVVQAKVSTMKHKKHAA